MNCPKCGAMNANDSAFCAECGARLQMDTIRINVPVPPVPPIPTIPQPIPTPVAPVKQEIPGEYSPLSPWAYFGWQLLFAIPFVGFVLLIVMSFAPRNKNLKNFARSYWCALLIVVCIAVVVVALAIVLGGGIDALTRYIS